MDELSLQHAVARFGTDIACVIDACLHEAYQPDRAETRRRHGACMSELRAVRGFVRPGEVPQEWAVPVCIMGELERCRAVPGYLQGRLAKYERDQKVWRDWSYAW